MFAVFVSDRQVSKAHPNRETAVIEAFELGLVMVYHGRPIFSDGVAIRELARGA